jgi:hypothetical protein
MSMLEIDGAGQSGSGPIVPSVVAHAVVERRQSVIDGGRFTRVPRTE